MAKRRPSGDGMVRLKKENQWEGRIVVGHKQNGDSIFRYAYGKTQKEMIQKLNALKLQYQDANLNEDSNITLSEWLDKWINELMPQAVRPTTLKGFELICRCYIDPKNDKFEFDDEQKEELRNFGDAALVILDSEEFLARIKKAAEEKGCKIYFNKVHYYDEKIDWVDIFISLIQGTHNIAFWKRKAYSNQQEFRIVIPVEDYTEDHIELDIGDISDISKIFTTEQVLTMQVKKK